MKDRLDADRLGEGKDSAKVKAIVDNDVDGGEVRAPLVLACTCVP